MRLGDLDALKKHIEEIFEIEEKIDKKWAMGLKYSLKIIDKTPTVEPFEKIGAICNENCGYRPQGEWIPIKYRPLTVDERISLAEHVGVEYSDTLDEKAFDCPMPEDGQRILLSRSWGVDIDVADNDVDGEGFICYGLEGNGDWDGVIAWQPLPKPYKDPLDHSFEDIRCKAEKCSPEGCKHCEGYEPIEFGGDKE